MEIVNAGNFFKKGYQSSSTIEHDVDSKIQGVTIVESWIKTDLVNDKSVVYGMNEPIGTWYASMKIDNDEIIKKCFEFDW